MQSSANRAATVGGFVAICLWATTIAVVGSLASTLGVWSASSTTQAMAGALGLLLGGQKARGWHRLPGRYLAVCGGFFVLYMVLLSAAIGAARHPGDLVAVSVLNYLWPALTVAFSVPLFGYKTKIWLWPSLLLGSAGAWLAIVGDQPEAVLASPNWVSWLCAAGGAVAWAAYSNLTRRLGHDHQENAVPVFMLASSLTLALGGLITGHGFLNALTQSDAALWAALLYMALLPGWLAYSLWDRAMRAGNQVLVAAASYATPIGSALAISAVHGLELSWHAVAAVLLVLAGGVGSRWSVHPASPAAR